MDYSSIFAVRANRYRDAQARWPEIRRAELECFAALLNLQAGERVLDVPAGSAVLKDYLPSDIHYCAQDPAPAFAAACRAQGLDVCCAPLSASGLASHGFDVVGSLTGMHHALERGGIYAEWWRLLRPGGRLVVMDVAAGSAVGRFLNGFVNRWNSQGHRGDFIDLADESSLRDAGFIQVERLHCEYDWLAADELQMLSFMTELFGLDRQPPVHMMAAELASELNAGYREGGYRVPWALTVLCARKPGGISL